MSIYLKHFWWVIICMLGCGLFYEHSQQRRDRLYEQLERQAKSLLKEKELAELERERLQLEINSQSDPDWIEMTLISKLGMIPTDSRKVMFTRPQD